MHEDKFEHEPRGEFRGDFTRDTFDPSRHFSRVLMQQGRVQVDADWNEQVSIFSYYLRKLGAGLMGPHGAPRADDGGEGEGFKITAKGLTIYIASGDYYVKGILCENNNEGITYLTQPDFPFTEKEKETQLVKGKYLVYLDVWERHLSYVEDDYMREVALGGPDTATRAKVVWQVKLKTLEKVENAEITENSNYEVFLKVLDKEKNLETGKLRARAKKDNDNDPCLTSPESRYRGAENQLYRVEIHKGSTAGSDTTDKPTFKWSRENGSVIYPVKKVDDKVVTLEHLGRDKRFGLKPNDWVEIVDDDYVLQNRADPLLQVVEVDHENLQVKLIDSPTIITNGDTDKHPYLRRWDQREGNSNGVSVVTSPKNDSEVWLTLEDGVQIHFPEIKDAKYRTGDYWLIPARTETGDVEWPGPVKDPTSLTPHGVIHHYAPLQLITVDSSGNVTSATTNDLRRKLKPMW